jgi:phosphate starvation-inducible PhoH-like protein
MRGLYTSALEVYLDDRLTIVLDNKDVLSGVCGANDGNLRVIEGAIGGRIATRGNELSLEGGDEDTRRIFRAVVDSLIATIRSGDHPSPEFVKAIAESASAPSAVEGTDPLRDAAVLIPHGFARVFPRSLNQAEYIRGMRSHDIVFCVGPAGTGKTYLAVAEALREVLSKKRRKLVLTRPVVEAGESLGFLPGDLAQKISPYLRPLYDAMEALIPYESVRRLEETRTIEIAPLAYMRGRSLNDCVVILDEAQNTTKEQMKMFLTRIGEGSKAIVTGDATQIDLPRRSESGLIHALSLLTGVEGLHFSYLNTADVVRNPLIKKIIQAYERETI